MHFLPPLEFIEYVLATLLNCVLSKPIKWLIQSTMDRFAKEAAIALGAPHYDGGLLQQFANERPEVKAEVAAFLAKAGPPREELRKDLQKELGSNRLFGGLIGLLERQIYLYGLIMCNVAWITPVVIFKAFFTWIDIRQGSDGKSESLADRIGKSPLLLSKYYGYLVGNFVSILTAIGIFHVVDTLVKWTFR
jgi:hypothetical protein